MILTYMYVLLLEEVASEIDDAASEASSSKSCLLTLEEAFLPIRNNKNIKKYVENNIK